MFIEQFYLATESKTDCQVYRGSILEEGREVEVAIKVVHPGLQQNLTQVHIVLFIKGTVHRFYMGAPRNRLQPLKRLFIVFDWGVHGTG